MKSILLIGLLCCVLPGCVTVPGKTSATMFTTMPVNTGVGVCFFMRRAGNRRDLTEIPIKAPPTFWNNFSVSIANLGSFVPVALGMKGAVDIVTEVSEQVGLTKIMTDQWQVMALSNKPCDEISLKAVIPIENVSDGALDGGGWVQMSIVYTKKKPKFPASRPVKPKMN